MRKTNDSKDKKKLMNVGTATALTLTLATSNPALAYADELEAIISEETINNQVCELEELTQKLELIEEAAESAAEEQTITETEEEIVIEEVEATEVKEEEINEEASTKEDKKQKTGQGELDLTEWDYVTYSSTIVLNKYKGNKSNIVIPAETYVDNAFIPQGSSIQPGMKSVKIGTIESGNPNDCFVDNRNNITNLEFKEVNGKKVDFSFITRNSFANFKSLINLDLSGANLSYVNGDTTEFFSGCTSLETLNLSKADLSNVTSLSNMFRGCTAIKHINLSDVTTSNNLKSASKIFEGLTTLQSVNIDRLNLSNVKNIHNMFNGCSSLTSIDLSKFDTSNITNLTGLLIGCSSLTDVKLGGAFNTSNVTMFNNMFKDCTNLKSIDTSLLDTSKAENMSYMFSDSGVETLDLTNFNTNNVTDMTGMFRNTINLNNISFGANFNTNNVTKMPFMFCNSNVNNLDLSNFDTSNVLDMTAMFGSLDNINLLDLSNFTLNPNVNTHRMFARHISVESANANIIETNDNNLKKELLVITTDNKLKSYNYIEDYCLQASLKFKAVGGHFKDGSDIIEFKSPYTMDKLPNESVIDAVIKEIRKNIETPTQNGHDFVSWISEVTETSPIFDKLNATYYAEWAGIPVVGPEDYPIEPDTSIDPDGFKPVEDGTANDRNEVDEEGAGTPVVRPDDVPIEPDASIDPDGFKPVEDGTHMDKNEVDEEGADIPVILPDDVPVQPDDFAPVPENEVVLDGTHMDKNTVTPNNSNTSNNSENNNTNNNIENNNNSSVSDTIENPKTGDIHIMSFVAGATVGLLGLILINKRRRKK